MTHFPRTLVLWAALWSAAVGAAPTWAWAYANDEAVDSARSALEHQGPPWYDPATDDLRTLELPPPPPPPTPDYPDWEWGTWNAPTAPTISTNFWGFFEILFYGVLLLVFGALVALLMWTFTRRETRGSPSTSDETPENVNAGLADRLENLPFPVRRPTDDLLAEAGRLYAAGNYNEAMVYLYSYELVELDRHQHIRLARGKTNRQYMREVRPRPELARLFEQAMVAFEDVFFGQHLLLRERFERCWNALDQFHSLVRSPQTA